MKNTIRISRAAHYHLQKPEKEIRSILIAIHGFGQLAEEFIREFEFLKATSTLVIAPEAISKFYNKEGKAVANWMTSHERVDEIEDYMRYLNKLMNTIREEYGKHPVAVLGFSQGTSTALRWLSNGQIDADFILACSGTIPPELKKEDFDNIKTAVFNYYFGSRDKLLTPENANKQIQFLIENDLNVVAREFDGRHQISSLTKADLLQFSESC